MTTPQSSRDAPNKNEQDADRPNSAPAYGTTWHAVLVSVGLAVVTCLVFHRVVSHPFVYYDDMLYVTQNEDVQAGLTQSSVRAAFTKTVAANWHPLTMLSHMLDCQLYGVRWPGGHHLTSLVLHVAATIVLFLVLRAATGQLWPAALVAALFAWHPTHVESVAWVSERKDVLSSLLGFAAIGAYVGYARCGRWWRYALVMLLFCASLMAKPMFVTLPFVLLVLDDWPLGRLRQAAFWSGETARQCTRLVWEKLPLFGITVAFCIVTYLAQQSMGAVRDWDTFPLDVRFMNAVLSYRDYLGKLAWPTKLAVLYPLLGRDYIWTAVIVNLLLLVVVTGMLLRYSERHGYLACGWLWYLGTLVPVIGIVQVGAQAMADRYTYVPFVGIFLAVAYAAADLARHNRLTRVVVPIVAVAWLAVLATVAHRQVNHWRDTASLFAHTLSHTRNNYIGHYSYANGLIRQYESQQSSPDGAPDESLLRQALAEYGKALTIRPNYARAFFNRGYALRYLHEYELAADDFRRAIEVGHKGGGAYANLGECLLLLDSPAAALEMYEAALVKEPSLMPARQGRANALAKAGRADEALREYRAIVEAHPTAALVWTRMAWLLATNPDDALRDGPAAVADAQRACTLTQRNHPRALDALAAAFAESAQFELAVSTAQEALRRSRERPHRTELRRQYEQQIAQRIEQYSRQEPFREPPEQADTSYLD